MTIIYQELHVSEETVGFSRFEKKMGKESSSSILLSLLVYFIQITLYIKYCGWKSKIIGKWLSGKLAIFLSRTRGNAEDDDDDWFRSMFTWIRNVQMEN